MAVQDWSQQQRQQGSGQRYTELLLHQPQIKSTPSAGPPIEAASETPPAANAAAVANGDKTTPPNHDCVVTTNPTAAAVASIESTAHRATAAATAAAAAAAAAAATATAASGYGDEMWQKHFKHLPAGTKPVKFVGEGAANAVFEIKIPQHGLSDQNFKGLLLRVAKVPSLGQLTTYNYLFQQKYYQTAIKPLLGGHAIHQELVILRGSGIVDELNRLLQDLDHTRKPKFRGSYVGLSDWGLLIEDMRPDRKAPPPHGILVEFKPKWLSQSRSAPADAVRCRQCALDLQRLLTKPPAAAGPGKFAPERKPCPLALVDEDAPGTVSSPFRIAPEMADLPERDQLQRSLERILQDPFLDDLRVQQELLDVTGPLHAHAEDEQFGIAMTIRDCTCFALISRSAGAEKPGDIKIRLGDLDWKDPQTKIRHWRGTERALVDGGFYTADYIVCDGVYYYTPTLCLLEWKPRAAASSSARPAVIQLKSQDAADVKLPPNVYTHKVDDVAALRDKLQRYQGGAKSEPTNPHRPAPY